MQEYERQTYEENIGAEIWTTAMDRSLAVKEEDWRRKKENNKIIGIQEWEAVDLLAVEEFPGNKKDSNNETNRN